MTSELCGYEKDDGGPCQLPASRPDGRCHHHTQIDGARANGGRQSKLTEGRQENIAVMIEDGHSIGAAARSNGINVSTFFNWMEKGEQQDDGPYADFYDRLTRARGNGERKYVDTIAEIARETNDTATLMTLLKSRYPDAWGDVERGEQTGGVEVVLPEEATIE